MEVFMTMQPYEERESLLWPFREFFPSMKSFAQSTGISMWEEEGDIVVEAALPGIDKGEIDLTFERGVLTICAQKTEKTEDKNRKYYQKSERSFMYTTHIPGELDENIEPQANLENGILQIRFKKHKRTAPRKIEVKGA